MIFSDNFRRFPGPFHRGMKDDIESFIFQFFRQQFRLFPALIIEGRIASALPHIVIIMNRAAVSYQYYCFCNIHRKDYSTAVGSGQG